MSNLSETEYITLKKILKLDENTIRTFERLELSEEIRSFIIFNMMVSSYQKTKG